MIYKYLLAFTCALFSLNGASTVIAQVGGIEGLSQEEIESRLAEILSTRPGSNLIEEEGADAAPQNIVEELQVEFDKLDEIKHRDLTKEQRSTMGDLRVRLKAAKKIKKQLTKTPLAKFKANNGTKSEQDFFLIATLDVAAQSNSADIRFSSMSGEVGGTNELYDYIDNTPAGGFRDYRIFGRYVSSELANHAAVLARQDYDASKERERQMIAYIQARQKEMSRVKATRRC